MNAIVAQLREQARSAFQRHGLPTTRLEHWKYTDVKRAMAPFVDHLLQPEEAGVVEVADDVLAALAIGGLDVYRIVLVDGIVQQQACTLPAGVRFESLAALLAAQPEQGIEPLQFDEQAPLFSGFVALNAALARDGVGICVDDDIRLDKPLYLLHVSTGKVAHICHGMHIGRHAEATIIEHYVGLDDAAGLTNSVSQLRLADGAVLHHVRLQQESARQTHVGRVAVQQGRDSCFTSHSIALGAAMSRVDIIAQLAGEGAACRLDGLYLINGRQHADHHTVIEHQVPNCTSREMYRGVMDGRSRAVFNGRVVVHKGAVKTDSSQSNANLLLSGKAEIDTKPELEIYNDDVKCAHGATIGQLDEAQLFYLKSRGLSQDEARQLLTFAFADEVLTGIDIPALRRHIEHAAFSKLPHGEDIEDMLADHVGGEFMA